MRISTNCLSASCAVKTSRALARKRDHRDHNARQWRAMTFIPASFMKLFIRYREELKRSVRVLWSLSLAVCQTAKERGMCRKTRVRTPNGSVSDGQYLATHCGFRPHRDSMDLLEPVARKLYRKKHFLVSAAQSSMASADVHKSYRKGTLPILVPDLTRVRTDATHSSMISAGCSQTGAQKGDTSHCGYCLKMVYPTFVTSGKKRVAT